MNDRPHALIFHRLHFAHTVYLCLSYIQHRWLPSRD